MNDQNEMDAILSEALEHHGVKNQKWGKRHGPPYPLGGSDKARAKEAYAKERERKRKEKQKEKIQKRIEKEKQKQAKKEEKAKKEAERAEEKARKEAEDIERQKKKYSRDPKEVYKHRELYTLEELDKCLKTFEADAKVKSYIDKDYERAKNNMARFSDWGSSIAKAGNTAIDLYNLAVSVDHHFGGDLRPFNKVTSGQKPQNDTDKLITALLSTQKKKD